MSKKKTLEKLTQARERAGKEHTHTEARQVGKGIVSCLGFSSSNVHTLVVRPSVDTNVHPSVFWLLVCIIRECISLYLSLPLCFCAVCASQQSLPCFRQIARERTRPQQSSGEFFLLRQLGKADVHFCPLCCCDMEVNMESKVGGKGEKIRPGKWQSKQQRGQLVCLSSMSCAPLAQ